MSVVLGEVSQLNGGAPINDAAANSGWRGSRDVWLDAAHQALINGGVQNVRILPLAKSLGLSRTSFYWFFKSREALLEALLQKWRDKNMAGLAARTRPNSKTITAAVLGVSHLWLEEENFDCEFEFAVRSWGLAEAQVLQLVRQVDEERLALIRNMFTAYGFEPTQADIRARTLYQTQIGYISMRLHLQESHQERLTRMVDYAAVFSGQKLNDQDWEDFTQALPEKTNDNK